ncbi:hypothetical protein V5J35_004911 [Endozoicomonas sp. NE40]|uniref:Transposase n=1 Tax=Endozoicomonas lisbonensis TaxID=3120522 RepID=A0ABV2SP93_9GAMM
MKKQLLLKLAIQLGKRLFNRKPKGATRND